MVESDSSGSSSSSKLRECSSGLKFLLDKNLSPYLSAGLRAFGENVIHLVDVLPENTQDTELLKYVGERGIFLITRDEKIRWNPAEALMFRKYNVGAFFLGGKGRSRCEMILQLVRNWPKVKEHARRNHKPFIFRIPPNGAKFDSVGIR